MLTNNPSRYYSLDEESDFIHNYYERLVLQEIVNTSEKARQDREFLADVACVALNRLPPRYIRHDVDMTFFMSPQDMQEIESKVSQAVVSALLYVESRERGQDSEAKDTEAKGAGSTTKEKAKEKKVVRKDTAKKSTTKH